MADQKKTPKTTPPTEAAPASNSGAAASHPAAPAAATGAAPAAAASDAPAAAAPPPAASEAAADPASSAAPAADAPAALAEQPPLPPDSATAQPEPPAAAPAAAPAPAKDLPSDTFPTSRPTEPAEDGKPQPASKELEAATNTCIDYLLRDQTNWKAGVPVFGDRWQPIYEQILSGLRPIKNEPDVAPAREICKAAPVLLRIYPGPSSKERLLVVRIMGTTFFRAEVLPWTMCQ